MASGIYRWMVRRRSNPPLVYIGQSVKIEKRRLEYIFDWQQPECIGKQNKRLYYAVRKYGADAVSFDVVEEVPNRDLLTERERLWYWHYKRMEELGCVEVANFVVPSQNPMHNAEVIARRSASEWKVAQAERGRRARARTYPAIVAPDGTEYRDISDLSAFCRKHDLNIAKMNEVVNGKRPHHKQWRTLYERCDQERD